MDNTHDNTEGTVFADEIAPIPAPVGSAAGAIHARIEIERDRIRGEEAIEAQLTTERKRLLVEGSDAEVDEVERRIDASRGAQVRILERVDLLRGQLIAANEAEESARLDDIAARGNRARVLGEQLIAEYAKRAPELAGIIERLAACEHIVHETNEILHRAKRESDAVLSPNQIRCRPRRRWKEMQRRKLGPHDEGHPAYGKAFTRTSHTAPVQKVYVGSEEFDLFTEVEVEVEMHDGGDRPDPLHESTVLPGIGPAPENSGVEPLWETRLGYQRVSDAVLAEVRERIDREPNETTAPTGRRKKTEPNDS